MDGAQEIVLSGLQDLIVHGDPGRYEFGDASFHNLFCHFGILQLVANGHPETRLDQLGQIGVERVVRKSGEGRFTLGARAPFCQDDSQYSRGYFRIFPECLIEVPDPKEKNGIRILGLDAIVLLHQGGHFL